LFIFFFFFFQAEDGIRDLYVTGVQTCALPIFFPFVIPALESPHVRPVRGRGVVGAEEVERRGDPLIEEALDHVRRHLAGLHDTRSEERRVGKECRARWWPYQ